MMIFMLITFYYMGQQCLGVLFHDSDAMVAFYRRMPGFVNPRFFAQAQIWTLPLLVCMGRVHNTYKIGRILIFVLCVMWWVVAFVHLTKGILFVILGAPVLCAFLPKQLWLWLKPQLIYILLALAATGLGHGLLSVESLISNQGMPSALSQYSNEAWQSSYGSRLDL